MKQFALAKQFTLAPVLFLAASMSLVANQGTLPKIDGTAGADVIDRTYTPPTTDRAEDIDGKGGDDSIDGQGGDDEIHGGGGKDAIAGGSGDDIIYGGGDDDVIHGDSGDDTVHGDQGDDRIFGGVGDDTLEGNPHDDYIDGGTGADTLYGGTNDDLVIGRDGDDTLIAGPGDDFIVIIGNSVTGYTIHGDSSDPSTGNTGSDMLYFAADVNPRDFKVLTVVSTVNGQTFKFRELEFSYPTKTTVHVDALEVATAMRHIDGYATGTGNDVLFGTDMTGHSTYFARFLHSGTPMQVDELFFTDAGDDQITTREGDDFVDAGAGDDTIRLGSGACIVLTGPGNDAVHLEEGKLDGPEGNRHVRILDLASGDKVFIDGSVAVTDITLSESADAAGTSTTVVAVNGTPEIELVGIPQANVQVTAVKSGVQVTASAITQGPGK